jgi:hypothetical protein
MKAIAIGLLFLVLRAEPFVPPKTPYIPPKTVPVTDNQKCDWGRVLSVDAAASRLRVNAPDGVVTYQVSAQAPVIGADGKSVGTVAGLNPGTKVRIYYVVDDGAKVQEVDLCASDLECPLPP